MRTNVSVLDRNTVDVTASLNEARRLGLLTEQTAPFTTRNLSWGQNADGTCNVTVTVQWRDGSETTGDGEGADTVHGLFAAYQRASVGKHRALTGLATVSAETFQLESGLGAEPVTRVGLHCRRNGRAYVAAGTHTDMHEAAWQVVSDVYTWLLMYDD